MDTKVTFHLPYEIHRRLKIAAAQRGKTMREILVELLTGWLAKVE
jgi:plasmid stability protein